MERPNLTPAQKSMMRAILIAVVLVSILLFLSVAPPRAKEEAAQPSAPAESTPPQE